MEEKKCPVDRERVLIGLECCREQDCIRCTYDCGSNEDFDRLLFDTVAYIRFLEERIGVTG